MDPITVQHLIPEEGGPQPGSWRIGQELMFIKDIEDKLREGWTITGLVLLYLTAAYDTENSWLLFNNLYHTTKDYHLTELMEKNTHRQHTLLWCAKIVNAAVG